jgi:SAM-dependent methyltransferase
MLTADGLAFLRTDAGADLLAEAALAIDAASSELQALTRLRRRHPPQVASAALETVLLRRRASRKFSRAAQMFFTRDGLEQASGEAIASHCARRFTGFDRVADLGCGIGGDSLALAKAAPVVALDRDQVRLQIARANVAAYGRHQRVDFLQADVLRNPFSAVRAAWCDPSRRSDGKRIFDVRRYDPPLASVLALTGTMPALGIKVAPGIRDEDVPSNCEVEFIQEGGKLKQAVLWLGPLATATRRATLLPAGHTLTLAPTASLPCRPPRGVLYEPGPAIIRAHLVEQLGASLEATRLDETIAFLSSDQLRTTPYATAYLVDEWLPFNLKSLKRRLRALHVGAVVVKKRGSPLDPQELEHALSLDGSEQRTLVLTHVLGRHAVLICRTVPTGPPA